MMKKLRPWFSLLAGMMLALLVVSLAMGGEPAAPDEYPAGPRPGMRILAPELAAIEVDFPSAGPQTGPGVVISVTTTIPDANPDGMCSLIEAIDNANDDAMTHADCPAGAGPDVIELQANESYTATLVHNASGGPNGLPYISSDITVNGHGSTVARQALVAPEFRLFYVVPSGALTLNEVTVAGGALTNWSGGGIQVFGGLLTLNGSVVRNNSAANGYGGGIHNEDGTVHLTGSTISHNRVDSGAAYSAGGGISNAALSGDAIVVLTNSEVVSNTAGAGDQWPAGGGGIYSAAYALGTFAQVYLEHSTLSHNTAGIGGGAWVTLEQVDESVRTEVILDHATVSENVAQSEPAHEFSGYGGGFLQVAVMTATHSAIINNTALGSDTYGLGRGGGIDAFSARMRLTNTTVSGNRAVGTFGLSGLAAGISQSSLADNPGETILENATLSDNHAEVRAGALWSRQTVVTTIFKNTIISDNSAPLNPNCLYDSSFPASDGYNLEDLDECGLDQPTDLVNTDPLLGPLADNGGETPTHALFAGSPAIDHIPDATSGCATTIIDDQRGVARPIDGDGVDGPACDSGAYEFRNVPTDVNLSGLYGQSGAGVETGAPALLLIAWAAAAAVAIRSALRRRSSLIARR